MSGYRGPASESFCNCMVIGRAWRDIHTAMYGALASDSSASASACFFTFRGKYTTSTIAMWVVVAYLRDKLPTSDDLPHNTFSSVAIMRHDPNTFDASSV